MPYALRIGEDVATEEYQEGGDGNAYSDLADKFRKAVKLLVQRRFYRCQLRAAARHLAYLGGVAHLGDAEYAASVHHHRAAKHL